MEKLGDYEPSEEMFRALENEFDDKSLGKSGPQFRNYLETRQLTAYNYCSVLTTLLEIEDLTTLKAYAQLYQPNTRIENGPEKTYYVVLKNTKLNPQSVLTPNIDEVVFSKRSFLGRESILRFMLTRDIYSSDFIAKVTKVTRNSIRFHFIDTTYIKYLKRNTDFFTQPFNVIFRPSRIPFRLMYKAVEIINRPLLNYFPTYHISQPAHIFSMNLFNESIANNAEQLEAVRQIANGPSSHAPFIVFGPPGTGKTSTIVEAILQLYCQRKNYILVAAGSNSACDTVALRICEYFTSHTLLKDDCKISKTKLIRLYALSYNFSNVPSELKDIFSCRNAGPFSGFQIFIATLCTVGRLAHKMPNFTHIFIDEAATSTEPEALMGIGQITGSSCYIILSGDHKQLGPVIKNKRAAELGLGQSLMERLMLNKLYAVDKCGNYDHTLQARLRRNYRSHPAIVNIYNKLYYNDELIPMAPLAQVNQAKNWNKLRNRDFPVLFQAVQGTAEREAHSTSSFNRKEADVVCWYVKNLLETSSNGGLKLNQMDIGIVTPYLGQCKLLNRKFVEMDLLDLEVGTVEGYQGREKAVIIVSLVASNNDIRFLSNPRRVNVFLSRPKWLLILIGNPTTLRKNEAFKFIIDQCKLQRNYFDEDTNMTSISRNSINLSDFMSKLILN